MSRLTTATVIAASLTLAACQTAPTQRASIAPVQPRGIEGTWNSVAGPIAYTATFQNGRVTSNEAATGAVLANAMFGLSAVTWSTTDRDGGNLWLAEVAATAGLILLIVSLARSGRTATAPAAVGAYIGAAYWWTSSTSFANPAITAGRVLSDTFAGIAPVSALFFIAAQLAGAALGVVLVRALTSPRRGDVSAPARSAGVRASR